MNRNTTSKNLNEVNFQKWQHVFEHADWGVAVTDKNGDRIEILNPAFARMLGYSLQELEDCPTR